MKRFLLLLGVLIVCTGCTTIVAKYTVVSTKKVQPSRLGSCLITRGAKSVDDSYRIYFVIPSRSGDHGPLMAVNKLIESVPGGVAVVDCTVKRSWFHIPFIYGYYGFTAEGKVLVDPTLRRLDEEKRKRESDLKRPKP